MLAETLVGFTSELLNLNQMTKEACFLNYIFFLPDVYHYLWRMENSYQYTGIFGQYDMPKSWSSSAPSYFCYLILSYYLGIW